MSTSPAMLEWIERHAYIFSELQETVTGVARAAGDAARAVDRQGAAAETSRQLLVQASTAASSLLALGDQARLLPSIPDQDTQRHFSAGLARWIDAAQAVVAASERGDGPEAARAARALGAGTDEFLRAAVALRRATGQAPDPANPLE